MYRQYVYYSTAPEKNIAKEDDRKELWIAVQEVETHHHLVKIIQEYYKNNIAYVKQKGRLSEPIYTTKGLRQGYSLSPLQFNIYVEMALKNWKRNCGGMGIPVNETHLFALNFADDQAIFAPDVYD